MVVYSHSSLSCYEQCPYKFKLRYIDKVETEVGESIEAFLGKRVHEVLEKLYRDLMFEKLDTLEDLLVFLRKEWERNWSDDIVIINGDYTSENYLRMAERYITDYYNRYYPFNQGRTIALEERVLIDLGEGYRLQGFIDRLTYTGDGCYEIHDYKTNSRLPMAESIKQDRQLALYMIGVKDRYPDVRDVKLVWHFLAFDKEVVSTRSDEELERLKSETRELIKKIESDKTFETKPSNLCDWCEFKPICREWSHLYKSRENEYLNDPGVKLVDRYIELKKKHKQITLDLCAEIEKLEEAIIRFAEKEGVDVVFGTHNKVRIKEVTRYKFPSKHSRERKELEELLRRFGKLEEVLQLDTTSLNKIILDGKWDKDLIEEIKSFIEVEKSKRLYLSKIKNEEDT